LDKAWNVLFLCTGNSARSIMAEAMLNHFGRGRFKAYSAGSRPGGLVNPLSVVTLESLGLPTAGLRSKSWDEFAALGAPILDFIITVCDNAASEACPIWPGKPTSAHWGVADPAAVEGSDAVKSAAFRDAAVILRRRIDLFTSLPFEKLDALSIKSKLQEIGRK
jgi:arsenate reductase (thioredoxin)